MPPRERAGAIADDLEATLRAVATPERAEKERAYLKSDLAFLGATVPATRKAAVAAHRAAPDRPRTELVALVDELWGRDLHELRMAAVELLDLAADRLEPRDIPRLERLLRRSRTWALVDGLATGPLAALLDRHPDATDVLDRWAADADFWIRRSALLVHLPGLRRGEGDFPRFARYAEGMLDEREFFVRKAIGWVLREAGRPTPERVADWLAPRTHRASGVTVREAVKYLPAERREALLDAYRRGVPAA
jgi:3-methyladenine DNA glycosylase AlkD